MKKPRALRDTVWTGTVVTHHALARYRERIDPAATPDEARAAILAALAGARRLESQPRDCALYAAHGDAWRLVVRSAPDRARAVLTVLFASQDNEDPADDGPSDADLARAAIRAAEERDAEAARRLQAATPSPTTPSTEAARRPQAATREHAIETTTEAARCLQTATPATAEDRRAAHAAKNAVHDAAQRARTDQLRADMEAKWGRTIETLRATNARENADKRRAWDLLRRCMAHVPKDLCLEIDAAIPATYLDGDDDANG